MSGKFSLSNLFRPVDMTAGSPAEKIISFAIPMLLGNIAQSLYNTVDSIVVGKYVGDNALAAVGSASPVYNLLLVFFVGISTGATILVSQYVGARNREALSRSIGASIVLSVLSSLFVMVIGPLLSRPLLELLGTPESIIDWCESYLTILFLGLIGMALYNMLSGIMRGLGDSISALLYLLVACGLNIGLDIWFVAGFKMGVAGVALATVIAQFISCILCFIRLSRMQQFFDLKRKYIKLNGHYSTDIIKLGLPSGVSQMIFALSMVVVQSLTNTFGETIIAANVIVMRIDSFAMMPNFSFGAAVTTYAGQNVGARKTRRVYEGVKQGTFITAGVSAFLVAMILIFGRTLMGLFTNTDRLIDISNHIMRILAAGYVMMGVSQCFQATMRGAGDTVTPMWLAILTTVVIRVPLAYLLAYLSRTPELPTGSYECLPISLLVAWTVGMILSWVFYRYGKWRKKLPPEREEEPEAVRVPQVSSGT